VDVSERKNRLVNLWFDDISSRTVAGSEPPKVGCNYSYEGQLMDW
jgi:hypothetical protein